MGLDVFSFGSMVAILVLSVVGSSCGSDPALGLCQSCTDVIWPLFRLGFPCFVKVIFHVIGSSGQDFRSRLVAFLCVILTQSTGFVKVLLPLPPRMVGGLFLT